MESMLIVIASLSTTAAFVLGAIVFKLLRDERRRSEARVQVLMNAAGLAEEDHAFGAQLPAHELVPSHFHRISASETPKPTQPVVNAQPADDLDLQPAVVGVHAMFTEPEPQSPWPNRLAAAAACAVLAAVIGSFLFGASDAPRQSPTEDAGATAALELLALGHSADRSELTISGIVQNPRSSVLLSGVVVAATLLAEDGSLVGSVQAPLDFTRLRPGDESPFVLKAPVTTGVARYRVSFKNSKGGVLGHVDRRAGAPIARHD